MSSGVMSRSEEKVQVWKCIFYFTSQWRAGRSAFLCEIHVGENNMPHILLVLTLVLVLYLFIEFVPCLFVCHWSCIGTVYSCARVPGEWGESARACAEVLEYTTVRQAGLKRWLPRILLLRHDPNRPLQLVLEQALHQERRQLLKLSR